jgi:hypothetical protein
MFDQVLLLAMVSYSTRHKLRSDQRLSKGQTVYFGPNNKMLAYFENDLVKPLPKRVSPMDHYLDTINTDFHTVSDLDNITAHWTTTRESSLLEQIASIDQKSLESPYTKPKRRQADVVSQVRYKI